MLIVRTHQRALQLALRRPRLAVLAFPAFGASVAWFRGCFTRRAPWIGCSPATMLAASTRRLPVALTIHSTGPPTCRRSPFNRRAWRPVNSNVSAYQSSVMQNFLPISPPYLSFTAGDVACAWPAQPPCSARFAVDTPSLALGGACGYRRRPLSRVVPSVRNLSRSVARLQSGYGGRRINPSASCCSNYSFNRTANMPPFSLQPPRVAAG